MRRGRVREMTGYENSVTNSHHDIIPAKKTECGNIWYCCPRCNQKLFKCAPGARARGIQIKCKKCRNIINVSL